jgi:O-antigen ligase
MDRNKIYQQIDKIIYFSVFMYALVSCFSAYNELRAFLRIALLMGFFSWWIKRPRITLKTQHLRFLGIFYLIIFLSIFWSPFPMTYEENFSYFNNNYLNPLMGLFIIILFVRKKEWIKNLFVALAISFIINNLFGIYQFIRGENRVTGLTEHYMSMAGVIIVLFFAMLLLTLKKSFLPKYHWVFLLSTIISIPVIFFNGTRAIWFIFLLLLPILFFQLYPKKGIVYFLIILLLAGSCMFQIDATRQRFSTIADMQYQSNSERLLMWGSAWNMFRDYPLTGVGIGNYKNLYFEKYINPKTVEHLGHAHNVPLQLLAETGVIGFLGYAVFFGYVLFESFKRWRRREDLLGLMMFMMTAGFILQGFTEMNLGNNLGITRIYWFIFGMYLVLTDAIAYKIEM